ncbi:MAG: hypothetical protein JNL12_00275 [Planctomycetes bacterium]|nr:hypothetical protein [Planctomycetota bacterium]
MKQAAAKGLELLLAVTAAGCVQGSYNRATVDEPLRPEWLQQLQPGRDSLGDCLQRLGAPHRVFEYAVEADGRSGMALLWVWRDVAGFGIDVSGGTKEVSGSVSFDLGDTELPGCVLWFDAELRLQQWRTGTLGDLLPGRARPSAWSAQ